MSYQLEFIKMDANLTTFNEIIEKVLDHEGGYVNDPTDRGGETNFGIAKRFYPDVDIKNLTKEQAINYAKKNNIDYYVVTKSGELFFYIVRL